VKRPTIAVDLRALVGTPTGIGVATRALLLELARLDRYRLLGLSHREVGSAQELREAGVELAAGERGGLGVVWQQLHFAPQAQALGADVLWSPLQTLPWSPGLPSVVTVHDLTVRLFPETHRPKTIWSQRPFLRRSFAVADAILASSRATARDVKAHYPVAAGKLRVIPLGVDARYRPDAAVRARVRAELECPDGYLLTAGTLEPRKNLPTLFAAWERLRSEAHRASDGLPAAGPGRGFPPLVVVGASGWKNGAILDDIARLAPLGLKALGRVPDERLVELFQGAAVFAYPSIYEGFGLPPLEALACGLPTVVSNVSSLPEVVGGVGFRVPPHDLKAWGQALHRAWERREDGRLAQRAVAWARGFTWAASAERHAEVFDRVLDGSGRRSSLRP
jgi:glycosyltransferase involved in cell wall biosynthesis